MSKFNRDKRFFLSIIILLIIVAASSSLLFWNQKNTELAAGTFKAKIVKEYKQSALDGPDGYELDNGKSVNYFCGLCAEGYKGEVIGNPKIGDEVEIKADKIESSESTLIIKSEGTYIKKL